MNKIFFFWGCFKNLDKFIHTSGKSYQFKSKYKASLFNTEGHVYDFSNLSDREWFDLIYSLDRGIESGYNRIVTKVLVSKSESITEPIEANLYIPCSSKSVESFFNRKGY